MTCTIITKEGRGWLHTEQEAARDAHMQQFSSTSWTSCTDWRPTVLYRQFWLSITKDSRENPCNTKETAWWCCNWLSHCDILHSSCWKLLQVTSIVMWQISFWHQIILSLNDGNTSLQRYNLCRRTSCQYKYWLCLFKFMRPVSFLIPFVGCDSNQQILF